MKDKKYVSPCAYQGGKQRLSEAIINKIEFIEGPEPYIIYDLCCGSGAVSLEAIQRDNYAVMIDKNFYGLFWEKIGKGEFDLKIFQNEISKLPDVSKIQEYLKDLSNRPIDQEFVVYHYLLLQAGAFGSKQIWAEGGEWKNNTFRSYWLPTETSNRKSPVNPMMPMPKTLYDRVAALTELQDKITGYYIDVFECKEIIEQGIGKKIIYVDPPYKNTTGYKDSFDIEELLSYLPNNIPIYISEGYKMEGSKESWLLSQGREKGNISGTVKKKPVEEWLNYFYKMDTL